MGDVSEICRADAKTALTLTSLPSRTHDQHRISFVHSMERLSFLSYRCSQSTSQCHHYAAIFPRAPALQRENESMHHDAVQEIVRKEVWHLGGWNTSWMVMGYLEHTCFAVWPPLTDINLRNKMLVFWGPALNVRLRTKWSLSTSSDSWRPSVIDSTPWLLNSIRRSKPSQVSTDT